MEIKYRQASKLDSDKIIELLDDNLKYHIDIDTLGIREYTESYGNKKYQDIQTKIKDKSGYIIVAEYKNEIIGFGFCYLKSEKEGHISKIFVIKKYRSKGIGKKIFKLLENYLINQNCIYFDKCFLPK